MSSSASAKTAHEIISKHEDVEVWKNPENQQHALHAAKSFDRDEVICSFEARDILPTPTYLTVQIAADQHILLHPEHLQYANHSCSPNVFFDTSAMKLIALETIQAGDELRFFYPSSEWEMDQPFVCNCGSPDCLQLIQGAANLNKEMQSRYRLTQFIHDQLTHKNSFKTD